MIQKIRHYKPDPHQESLDFADDQPAANTADITENDDAFALHRNFSPDSVFEQEKTSRRNMEKLMRGERPASFDWKDGDAVHALIARLGALPPDETLREAMQTGITSMQEEVNAWYFERNLMSGSGEPIHGGKRWAMGQNEHLHFVDTTRRAFYLEIARETLDRGAKSPAEAVAQMQEELKMALREATGRLHRPR